MYFVILRVTVTLYVLLLQSCEIKKSCETATDCAARQKCCSFSPRLRVGHSGQHISSPRIFFSMFSRFQAPVSTLTRQFSTNNVTNPTVAVMGASGGECDGLDHLLRSNFQNFVRYWSAPVLAAEAKLNKAVTKANCKPLPLQDCHQKDQVQRPGTD